MELNDSEEEDKRIWKRGHGYIAAKSLQSCLTLYGPIDSSPSGSPVPGILRARTLEWVAISFSSGWNWKVKVKSLSRLRLCDPMDCNLPGFSIHGIFQARVLEWVGLIGYDEQLDSKDNEKPLRSLGIMRSKENYSAAGGWRELGECKEVRAASHPENGAGLKLCAAFRRSQPVFTLSFFAFLLFWHLHLWYQSNGGSTAADLAQVKAVTSNCCLHFSTLHIWSFNFTTFEV